MRRQGYAASLIRGIQNNYQAQNLISKIIYQIILIPIVITMKTIIMIKMRDSFDLRFLSISVIIRSKVLNYKQG